MKNWFEMAKAYSLKEYLETHYNMKFKGNFTLCPFHHDSKPTFSLKQNLYKCFACDAGGDIVRFVESYHKLSPADAAKKILLDNGVEVDFIGEVDPVEQETRNKIIAQNARALELIKQKRDEQDVEAKKNAAIKNMNLIAAKYTSDLNTAMQNGNTEVIKAVESVFPRFFHVDGALSSIGWDWDNESVVTITRHINGNVMNIKRRTMVKNFSNWDVTKDLYDWKGDGKWIGWKDATAFPFGLLYQSEKDDRVFICEGEKDTFNLISLGINALTLGGANSSWEPYKNYLKGKKVYIWFDHDQAGYSNALKRYYEIKDISKSCQIVLFNKLEHDFPRKGDISDYLSMYKFYSSEDIFNKIVYSSFLVHNELIQEIDDLYEEDEWKGHKRPIEFIEPTKKIKFNDMEDVIVKNCRTVRGEKDNELKALAHLAEELRASSHAVDLERYISSFFNNQPQELRKEVEKLVQFTKLKKTVMNDYRQVHIYDIVKEANRAVDSCGYMFAKFRGHLYIWTGAYYYRFDAYSKDQSEIKDFILKRFFPAIEIDFKKQTVKTANETVENIVGHAISLERWRDAERRVITMNNGALIINQNGKTIFRYESSKKDCAFNIIDINYDEKSTAPKWEAFLNRVLPVKEDQLALMEFIGYCLLPSHRFEKFLLLYGQSGANGKSVVLSVISSFFGDENVSRLNLHQMRDHQLEALTDKMLNIGTELEAAADLREQLSTLKALISPDDSITVNPKHDKPFELMPDQKPKMAFATNKLSKSGVNDGGVLRRMLLLNFSEEIQDDEKIRDLTKRFHDERSGILNLAIEGLKRLIKQGKFSMSETRAAFMDNYRDDIDPIRVYSKEALVAKDGVMTAKSYVYEHYKVWCEEKGTQPYTQRTFFSRLEPNFKGYEEWRTTKGNDYRLPANAWYIKNAYLSSDMIEEINFKKEVVKIRETMVDMNTGATLIFE